MCTMNKKQRHFINNTLKKITNKYHHNKIEQCNHNKIEQCNHDKIEQYIVCMTRRVHPKKHQCSSHHFTASWRSQWWLSALQGQPAWCSVPAASSARSLLIPVEVHCLHPEQTNPTMFFIRSSASLAVMTGVSGSSSPMSSTSSSSSSNSPRAWVTMTASQSSPAVSVVSALSSVVT